MNPKRQQATPAAKDDRGTQRAAPATHSLEDLLARSKQELLALATKVGLKGVSKLVKAELAQRVLALLHPHARSAPPAQAEQPGRASAEPPARTKSAAPPEADEAAERPRARKGAEPKAPQRSTAAAEAAPPARPRRDEAQSAKPEVPAAKPTAPEPPPAVPAAPISPGVKPPAPVARAATPAPAVAPPPAAEAEPPAPVAAGATAEPPAGGAVPAERPSPAAAARLDLGRPSPAPRREEHIPWSYGHDRVTAMAIDPGNLYAYWEVTDPAIERARAALGAAGEGAWLNLRVYDVTGILFDGGNAHSWFDHGLGRSDRQWFFSINKPSSSVFVEIGLRAADGGFARIARSARVDFPRAEPSPWNEPEWMTVLASGEQYGAGRGTPARGDGHAGAGPGGPPGGGLGGGERHEHVPIWILLEPGEGERRFRELFGEQFERIEWQSGGGEGWYEFQGRLEWQVGPVMTSWEEGPFTYPVQVAPPERATWEGGAIAYTQGGMTRVVYGPWAVEIKNLRGRAQHAVVGRWQIYRSWATRGGVEELQRYTVRMASPGGASEQVGASAWLWQAGSELRLGGASELWRLGASEVRLRGASEVFYAGASERRMMGASERRMAGASEWRLAGASERRLGGASEKMRLGASEWRLGGASERQLIGASERRLLGASERMLGASEQRLGGASEERLSPAAAPDDDDWDWEPPADLPTPGRE